MLQHGFIIDNSIIPIDLGKFCFFARHLRCCEELLCALEPLFILYSQQAVTAVMHVLLVVGVELLCLFNLQKILCISRFFVVHPNLTSYVIIYGASRLGAFAHIL